MARLKQWIRYCLQMATLRHHQSQKASLFLSGVLLLLFRHSIAGFFKGDYYALAFYEIDLLVISLFAIAIRIGSALWLRCAIDFLIIFILGDFIERFFLDSSSFHFVDLLALLIAFVVVYVKYKPPKS